MAELLMLGSAAAALLSGAARLWPWHEEERPLYTLTPPEFDTSKATKVLTFTPLESGSFARQRLYTAHLSPHPLDISLDMAPAHPSQRRAAQASHDFTARIYLPRTHEGPAFRPLAEARLYMQHGADPNSFSELLLRTEAGGAAVWSGGVNLSAMAANRELTGSNTSSEGVAPGGIGVQVPAASGPASAYAVQKLSAPRGLSAFFNLPLFPRGAQVLPVAKNGSPFAASPSLRSSRRVGVRWDDRASDDRASWSLGLHLDPAQIGGAASEMQLGGWMAQESDNFRISAEGTLASMRPGQPAPQAEGEHVHPASVGAGAGAAAGGILPPRFRQSLPPMLSSRLGLYWTPRRLGPLRPGYELGATLANQGSRQELIVSYFHHLVVRRNVHNPFEKKENRAIHNYIDIGMELAYAHDPSLPSSASSGADAQAPSLRFGASWQPNKNSLLKLRLQDDTLSVMAALKSWWDPAASAAISTNYSLEKRQISLGLCLSLENIGEVLFSKADPAYRRAVASQRERIDNLVELDENY